MRIIDSEAHVILPDGVEDAYHKELDGPAGSRLSDVVAAHSIKAERFESFSSELLAHMDRDGVEMTVIMRGYFPALNRDIARLVDEHHGRFVGFAAWDTATPRGVFPDETDDAIRALEQGLSMPQLVGVGEVSLGRFHHPHLTAEQAAGQFAPTLEACAARRCPVMFHTSIGGGIEPRYRDPQALTALARSFPTVPFLVAHMGGANEGLFRHSVDLAHRNPNVFLTTSAATATFVTRAVEEIGAQRVVFGSDWSPKTALKTAVSGTTPQAVAIETVRVAAIRPWEKEAILGENLAGLLGI